MELVPIGQIAQELGVSKDYALRYLKRRATALGITLERGSRNAVSLSRDDANRVADTFKPRFPDPLAEPRQIKRGNFGYFYIIQLLPDDLPKRLKIGYTDNLEVRLSDHRTSAPTLKLVRHWPCKRGWEEAARASITRTGCHLIGGEVFDGDPGALVRAAEAFFGLMPNPGRGSDVNHEDSTERVG